MPLKNSVNRLLARLIDRPSVTVSTLLLLWSLSIVLFYNVPFWQKSLAFLNPTSTLQWLAVVAFGTALVAAQILVFIGLCGPRTIKPVLTVMTLMAASTHYFSLQMGTYFDADMVTNLLETDFHESRQLLTWRLLGHLILWGLIPVIIIWRYRLQRESHLWQRRGATALLSLALLIVSLLVSFQSFSPLMRNHKELRYLITPGNVIAALPKALTGQAEKLTVTRAPIAPDAQQRAVGKGSKPLLLVVVVGETQRAANWQLNGYQRATTPNLADRDDLISFADVSSCGTSTAVSLPCMFSRQTHDGYQARRARSEQTLLDIAAAAGIGVEWIDNQSGCKGVCSEVETDRIAKQRFAELCADGECFDQVLVEDLKDELAEASHQGNQLLVLHMMGSHGPAYYRRYPVEHSLFTPDCREDELSHCSQQQIINAYDNTIAYTDFVLDQILDLLSQHERHDSALIYLSDHGESLGEMGLYLHGLPYFIAPDQQTKVPMFWWLSPSFAASLELDRECLKEAAQYPTSHDALIHSVLNLLNIETKLYNPELDPAADCKRRPALLPAKAA